MESTETEEPEQEEPGTQEEPQVALQEPDDEDECRRRGTI